MPRVVVPNSVSLQNIHHFLQMNRFSLESGPAVLRLHPAWMHVEPFALAMIAAWGAQMISSGRTVSIENMGPKARYLARMRLFDHLGMEHGFAQEEHEPAGRFLPVTRIRTRADRDGVSASISALLHLDKDRKTLEAVRYCVSELLSNVLEHSAAPGGAFVCAANYDKTEKPRVSLGVADCGIGVSEHLGAVISEVRDDPSRALELAMTPGITGARRGLYGTPENAGAGLFFTRCIAKASGGCFLIASDRAAYRLRRRRKSETRLDLYASPLDERHDLWRLRYPWTGTVVALEIFRDELMAWPALIDLIRRQFSGGRQERPRARFT